MGVVLCLHLSFSILPGHMHLLVTLQNGRVDLHPMSLAYPSQPYMPLPFLVEHSRTRKKSSHYHQVSCVHLQESIMIGLWTIIAMFSWKEWWGRSWTFT